MTAQIVTERILEERHVVGIIMYLHMFGPRSRSEIYKAVSTNPHMPRKLDMLEERGLVKTGDMVEGGRSRPVRLTHLGKIYAEALCSLEERSGGDLDRYRMQTVRDMVSEMERRYPGERDGCQR
ncbi:MAG: winged helix-turn-helix transcriptional regulator [Candidatus Methanomethylophilaceae archaeon]|nr:winged helix-turn-helix transcriptional regulator [Candidatus Methanomethylophilaceae archaeon]